MMDDFNALVASGEISANTAHGFEWGPVRVRRVARLPGGRFLVEVNGAEVYVSKTGCVRVFYRGKELK